MSYGVYLSADGAQAQVRRMEVIANNLANVDTVGFKRDLAIFQARYAEQIAQGEASPGTGSINDLGGGVMVSQTKTDFSPGPTRRTGSPTDLAIGGNGFFVVQKGDQTYLTRAGNFRVNEQGQLVTQQNWAVLDDSGTPVAIDPQNGPFEITADGVLHQQGSAQALALVKPASMGDLVKVGGNLFRPLADPQPIPPEQRNVAPGYLEMSGIRPTEEMVELIDTSRAIEADLNVMQTQDQMSGLVTQMMRGQ